MRRALLFLLFSGAVSTLAQSSALEDLLTRAQNDQAAGAYASAAAEYAQATVLDTDNAELWANRGIMENLSGQFAASLQSLQKSLAFKPSLFAPALFLGMDYLELSQPHAALPYLERAHHLRPDDPQAALTLARAYAKDGKPRAAAAPYSSAVQLKPDTPGAWFGLATNALALIDSDGAALAQQSNSPWAKTLYADELLTQGRDTEALALYREAAALADTRQKALIAAILSRQQQDENRALKPEIFNRLQALFGTTPATLPCPASTSHAPTAAARTQQPNTNRQAACDYMAADYDAGANAAADILDHTPADSEALYWSVKTNERIAVSAFSRFEELAPQAPATFVLVGDMYRRQRQPDEAEQQYRKALAIDAHDPAALLGLAASEFAKDRQDETQNTLRFALTDRPDDAKLNLLMGQSLVEKHRFDEARPFLEKCLRKPEDLADVQPLAHALLGRVDANSGQTDEAIRQMQLGLSSDVDGSLNFQLSRLYRKAGNKEASQQAEAQARALENKRLANAKIAVVGSIAMP